MSKKLLSKVTLVLTVISLTACEKLKDLADITFPVSYNTTEEVPGLPDNPIVPPGGLTTSIPTMAFETKSQEELEKNNTNSDLIQEVKLRELSVNIDKPSSQNFDIVDSIWVYLSGDRALSDEVLVAKKFGIQKGLRNLSMDIEDINLKNYFLKDSMYFRLKGHFYNAPDTTTVVTLSTRLNIVANPLKD